MTLPVTYLNHETHEHQDWICHGISSMSPAPYMYLALGKCSVSICWINEWMNGKSPWQVPSCPCSYTDVAVAWCKSQRRLENECCVPCPAANLSVTLWLEAKRKMKGVATNQTHGMHCVMGGGVHLPDSVASVCKRVLSSWSAKSREPLVSHTRTVGAIQDPVNDSRKCKPASQWWPERTSVRPRMAEVCGSSGQPIRP